MSEDGTFKPADALAELYGAKGIKPEQETIAYCRIGERSAHTWFVLHELLGHENVRNYDGSSTNGATSWTFRSSGSSPPSSG